MRTARTPLLLAMILLGSAMVVGCGQESTSLGTASSTTTTTAASGTALPTRPWDIAGAIVSVAPAVGTPQAGTILIAAPAEAPRGTLGDRASLAIRAQTPIGTCGPGDERQYGDFADLTVGAYVVAWVDGPVAESYPVQATATAVAFTCG